MGFWGDKSCHKNANVVGCALTCELIVLFRSTIYYIDDETDLKDLWFCFWNNVLNFVKTCTLSFQIDIWYIMTVSWILWTEESSWDILNKKKCCLSSTMWTLKSRKCENRFIYSISKNDAYGLWCGLWWDSVTLGEFTQGIHTQ